ncbi:MAG: phage shock protein B [Rhodospirillales bacterium RIFCSPLOWO2_12_FULL_58_28]|nr:MAG: phage shock protein B [Rhodospirillales bacterium RIFCSPLOWO2_02_FULL_58_16]OHC79924.1 MAG: phage shock protein B [Rhodospirillales bacterium RIFCSPLOWO2_12_FULL_58_28]
MSIMFFFPVIVIFMAVVLPVWIIAHYMTKWRTVRTLSSSEEKMLTGLWDSAVKMETRIKNLERILDAEAPDWREKI